jgi:hypothetical protein
MLDHRFSQEVGKGFPLETCRTIPGRNDSDNFHKIIHLEYWRNGVVERWMEIYQVEV